MSVHIGAEKDRLRTQCFCREILSEQNLLLKRILKM